MKARQVSLGSYHTVIINLDDDVLVFGYNYSGLLGLGDNVNRNTQHRFPILKLIKHLQERYIQ
jgi:alpha-tubulin suppressor-like RCC1 family protein